MRTFDKFMHLFVRFTICWTKVIQPHKLMYDGCNLLYMLHCLKMTLQCMRAHYTRLHAMLIFLKETGVENLDPLKGR